MDLIISWLIFLIFEFRMKDKAGKPVFLMSLPEIYQ